MQMVPYVGTHFIRNRTIRALFGVGYGCYYRYLGTRFLLRSYVVDLHALHLASS